MRDSDRKHRRLRLAPGGWSHEQCVLTVKDRADRRFLEGSEARPCQGVDHVMLQRRVKPVCDPAHSSRSTSSGSEALAAARSTSLSSPSETVSE